MSTFSFDSSTVTVRMEELGTSFFDEESAAPLLLEDDFCED